MNSFLKAIPVIINENMLDREILPDGSLKFISKVKPELNCITINRVANEISILCNGFNSIFDITDIISNKYGRNKDELYKDLFVTIRQFWKNGILAWGNELNPFMDEKIEYGSVDYIELITQEDIILDYLDKISVNKYALQYLNAYAFYEIETLNTYIKYACQTLNRFYFIIKCELQSILIAIAYNEIFKAFNVIFIANNDSSILSEIKLKEILVRVSHYYNTLFEKGSEINRFYFVLDKEESICSWMNQLGVLKKENRDKDYIYYFFEV